MRSRINCCLLYRLPLALLFVCLQVANAQQGCAPISTNCSRSALKHLKTIDNLDAIGSRNIGGGKLGNWYSLEREVKLGQDYANEVESFTKPLRDPFIAEYVNRVGQNLVRNSDAKVPFRIKIIDSDEINAFALPGGFLYVNSGLLLAVEDEAELAGIMAHEIAHVAARHATRQMTRSQILDLVSLPLLAFGGGIVIAARETVGSITTMKFSRNYEAEADYLGVEYAYKAGYDPAALITILERLRLQEKSAPGTAAKALSTHPQTADRIRRMQQEIASILIPRHAYVISTSDFDEMHDRLTARQTTHFNRGHDTSRPTLRRRGNPDASTSGSDGQAPVPQVQ